MLVVNIGIDNINRARNAIPAYPLEVLSYVFKHGYSDIMDEAAP
jgi:hypothetical protein